MTSPAPARWQAQRRLRPCLTPGRLTKSRAASLEKTSYLAPAAVHSLDRAGEAAIGSRQLHEAWMDHYVTQAASKAKPNGGIVKAGSRCWMPDSRGLKPRKRARKRAKEKRLKFGS